MVGFLVTILKILGFLLLGILCLILCLVLVILLCPVRYECVGTFREEKKASAKITWLFSAFHIPVSWDGEGLHISLKIFGMDWNERKKKKAEKAKGKSRKKRRKAKKTGRKATQDRKKVQEKKITEPEISDEDFTKPDTDKQNVPQEAKEQHTKEQQAKTQKPAGDNFEKPKEEKKERIFSKINGKLTDSMEKVQSLREKISKLNQQKNQIMDFLDEKEAQKAKSQVFGIGKKALHHILPYRLNASIRFGMEEPDKTGQILAVSSFFYGRYGDHLSLEPDFENKVLEGEFDLKGKIRLLNCVYYVINLYRIKKLKEFITLIKNI
jgi:hypothetical protein